MQGGSAPVAAQSLFLDHVGLIVPDLERSCELLERLGFRQTRRADHTRSDERGETVPAGSAQRSIMLQQGYIETMQITDRLAGHPLTAAAAQRTGLHILALGTMDASAIHADLARRGLTLSPLRDWSRPVREDAVTGLAEFRFFDTPWAAGDPSYVCWVQHRTPELMRPTQLLQHPNGALALRAVHYCGPAAAAAIWVGQLQSAGARLSARDTTSTTLALSHGEITVRADDSAAALLPRAISVLFADLDAMRQRCVAAGQQLTHASADRFELDLRAELGLVWICEQA